MLLYVFILMILPRVAHQRNGTANLHCADASDEPHFLRLSKRSAEAGACVLPPYPTRGTYHALNVPDARPGHAHDFVVLSVKCLRGYGIQHSATGVDRDGVQLVTCDRGKWFQAMPKCVRFCELYEDPSIRYMCYVPGSGLTSCGRYVPPGASVKPICNPYYQSASDLLYMQCVAGSWDYVPQCKAECGRITPDGVKLVINGTRVKRGELPWHVGVYQKTTAPYMQICGGTLISNTVVISAAHCFWDDLRKRLPAAEFAVAAGKIYRPWEEQADADVQKSDVKEIRIPRLFGGVAANYQEDIAILILDTAFVYKTYVRPVCLNFDSNFDRLQLQHGNIGKVAGWGLTSRHGKGSPVLKVANIPYIKVDTCINTIPASFRAYITIDKFCAGYTDGTAALCRGDSGGGLTFPERELGVDRYYLRGIVSAAPPDDSALCNAYTYITFTRISKHEDFIKESLAASYDESCPLTLFQCGDGSCAHPGADCNGRRDCADGSDEIEELCGISSNSFNCTLPPYPEHGTYTVSNVGNAYPGMFLEKFLLIVRCLPGYAVTGTDGDTVAQASCFQGIYEPMPKCARISCASGGVNGSCVPLHHCASASLTHIYRAAGYGDERVLKPAASCAGSTDVCCTDCDIGEQHGFENYVIDASGTPVKKPGSKARDKCLEYLQRLPYPCRAGGNVTLSQSLDTTGAGACYRHKLDVAHNDARPDTTANVREVARSELRHMALVGSRASFGEPSAARSTHWLCGGAVISERYVITGSLCVQWPSLPTYGRKEHFVGVGISRQDDASEHWKSYKVKTIVYYPERGVDIVLMKTDSDITFGVDVLPACIDTGHVDTGVGAEAAGYARERSDAPEMLVAASNLEEVRGSECPNSAFVCYKKRSCSYLTGPWGIVHAREHSCMYVVTGVSHYHTDDNVCLEKGRPERTAVFVRISNVVSWIEDVVWP